MASVALQNLTPHAVHFVDARGREVLSLPSEGPARVDSHPVAGQDDELVVADRRIPLCSMRWGPIAALPHPKVGVLLVVSNLVAEAAQLGGRSMEDLVVPTDVVRDAQGRPVGARGLVRGTTASPMLEVHDFLFGHGRPGTRRQDLLSRSAIDGQPPAVQSFAVTMNDLWRRCDFGSGSFQAGELTALWDLAVAGHVAVAFEQLRRRAEAWTNGRMTIAAGNGCGRRSS